MRGKWSLVAILILISSLPASAEITPVEQSLLDKLHGSEVLSTVTALCNPKYGGRRAGTEGDRLAAEYLANKYKETGLKVPDCVEDYKQSFNMKFALISDISQIKAQLTLQLEGKHKNYYFSYPYYYGSGGIDRKAALVFAGYGVSSPDQNYNDYANIDVHNKIVLLLSGEPKGIKGISETKKALTAYAHGAVGCLLIGEAGNPVDWDDANYGLASPVDNFPTLVLERELADKLLAESGKKLASLERTAQAGKKIEAFQLKGSIELKIPHVYDAARPTRNVMAVLPGTDPELKNEYVIVSAHFDHLGTQGGYVYNGADDDASGSAATIEIAKAISAMPQSPKRSILFVDYTGEEGGLIGSNYFVEHPPIPLKQIRAMLQMDMVGIGDPRNFEVTDSKTFPEEFSYIDSAAKDLGFKAFTGAFKGASDNLALARKKVPAFMFMTAGEHPYYHLPSDLPDTLNPKALENTAKLVALSAWRLAN